MCAFKAPNGVDLVTEFAPRGDLLSYSFHLEDLSKRKQLDSKLFPTLLFQMLIALKFLHDRHMVHGDVKPGNILIFENCFKIADFGHCSAPYPFPRQISANYGTVLYSSPESYRDRGYGRKADIWALGMTIFSLIWEPFPGWQEIEDPHVFFAKLLTFNGAWQDDAYEKTPIEFQPIVAILDLMLSPSLKERHSAEQLLCHPYLETQLSAEEVSSYFNMSDI